MKRVALLVTSMLVALLAGRPQLRAAEALPPPVDWQVDFHKDILAILANSCA